jgi:omega-6 fatty acid desaturase (delta-12 desaturase)
MTLDNPERKEGSRAENGPRRTWPDWYPSLAVYRNSHNLKAVWQLSNTLVPYCALWFFMIRSIQLDYPYFFTLLLAMPAGAFLVRIFILFHDCVHGSFIRSKRANSFWGHLFGILVFTPFEDWRYSHLRHHVTYANLNARGFGDIWTLTRREYEGAAKKTRVLYRLYRNPLVFVGLGSLFIFLLRNRLPTRKVTRKEHMSVIFTNLAIILVIVLFHHFLGWQTFVLIHLPVMWFAGAAGIWLFYVQHQFPGGYWSHKGDWEPLRAAMEGSSYYKLPAPLRWFSGNIGYHHIHHLNPRIPNYHLKRCYDAVAGLHAAPTLTFFRSFSCARLKMWDEDQQKMVPFH